MIDGFKPRPWPDWYTVNKHAAHQNRNVSMGKHPMGLRLKGGPETCGTCAHLRSNEFTSTYYKCDLHKNTGGPATDIRKKWPACEKWEKPCA